MNTTCKTCFWSELKSRPYECTKIINGSGVGCSGWWARKNPGEEKNKKAESHPISTKCECTSLFLKGHESNCPYFK